MVVVVAAALSGYVLGQRSSAPPAAGAAVAARPATP
jgi:hypothetical protein